MPNKLEQIQVYRGQVTVEIAFATVEGVYIP